MNESLGGILQRAREARALSRQQVADECCRVAGVPGFTEASVRFWEREQHNRVPTLAQFEILAEVLGLSDKERLLGLRLARVRAALTSTPAAAPAQ